MKGVISIKFAANAYTIGMNGVRRRLQSAVRGVRAAFDYLSSKKYTTLAGTMAFFLVMSVVPFLFWLTLLFGRLHIDYEPILELEFFADFKEIILYFRDAAESATAGASVVLLATTLYSSTNLFYHMRRSGEIIYECRRKKAALLVRLSALALIFAVMLLMLAGVSLFLLGSALLPRILPSFAAQAAVYALFGAVVFALLLLLNVYICPYRVGAGDVVWGSLLTLLLGGIASFGFSVYVRFSSVEKLYGAAVFLILFLLWLYVLMTCFVVGVILNCYLLERDKNQKIVHKKF